MKPTISLLLLVLTTSVLAAEPMTNDDVLRLVRAGISTEVIIEKIRTSTCAFMTDTETLISLRKQGVPDAVISAMLTPAAKPPATEVLREFPQVVRRLSRVTARPGWLRLYADRLEFAPDHEKWKDAPATIPWKDIASICYEAGPVWEDLYVQRTDQKDPIRFAATLQPVTDVATAVTAVTKRDVPECE